MLKVHQAICVVLYDINKAVKEKNRFTFIGVLQAV